jgi:AraC family ethanolamine operon transcriptional activator
MPVRWLKSSPVLRIERFRSFEEFRPNDVIGGGRSIPADPGHCSAVRAVLPLQDGLLVLQRSFARRLESNIGADHGVGLLIPLAFHATVNGRDVDNATIALIRGRTPIEAVELHPNTYLMLRLNSAMLNRGWAEFENGVRYFQPPRELLMRLRALVLDMFCLASQSVDLRQFDLDSKSLHESLIAILDHVLIDEAVLHWRPGSFGRHRKLVSRLDELADMRMGAALYSEELARSLGVSVRTLQTSVQQVHGVSLHQYLRSRRLWSVRKLLVTGSPLLTVMAAAQANGFWHMSDFSQIYGKSFGEKPSETLARARGL